MLSLYPVSSFEPRLFFLALAKLGDYLSLYGAPGSDVVSPCIYWYPVGFLHALEGGVYAAYGPIRIF